MSAAVVLFVSYILHENLHVDLAQRARAETPAVFYRIDGHGGVNAGYIEHFVRRLGAYHTDILKGLAYHGYREAAVHLRRSDHLRPAHAGLHGSRKQLLDEYRVRAVLPESCRRLERSFSGTHNEILRVEGYAREQSLSLQRSEVPSVAEVLQEVGHHLRSRGRVRVDPAYYCGDLVIRLAVVVDDYNAGLIRLFVQLHAVDLFLNVRINYT